MVKIMASQKFCLIFYILFCAFEAVVPKLWNTFPMDLRSADIFKSMLKTCLDLLLFCLLFWFCILF